jgi:hypothetical protein
LLGCDRCHGLSLGLSSEYVLHLAGEWILENGLSDERLG